MKDRAIKFDSDGWVEASDIVRKLHSAGYSVGAYKDNGTVFYALYRNPVGYNNGPTRYTVLLETTDPDELNNFVRLLLPPET